MDHWLELDEIAPTRSRGNEQTLETARSKQPRLYLSSGIADIELAYALKDALEDDGIEVLLKQDMDEQSLDALLETQRRVQVSLF